MTARESVVLLRTRILRSDIPRDAVEAVAVLIDHAGTLERVIDLLGNGVANALAHQPENAVHAVPVTAAARKRPRVGR